MAEHYELEPIGQDDPQQNEADRLNTENSTDINGRYSDHRDPPNTPVNYRNLAIAAFVFIVSLVLPFYTLSIFFTKNQDSTDNTPSITNTLDSFKGGEHGTGQDKCLLTINYTDYVKEVIDTTRNCTKMNNDVENLRDVEGGIHVYIDLQDSFHKRYSKQCFCAKQIPLQDKWKLRNEPCNNCYDSFPICQNGGDRDPRYYYEMDLYAQICGVCFCPKEYTGNYCHLPKKLECVKCKGTSCDDLPPCNNSTVRPCRESIHSQKMNCTKPEYTGNFCHLPKKLECVKCKGTSCDDLPQSNNSTVRPCRESIHLQKMNCTKPENRTVFKAKKSSYLIPYLAAPCQDVDSNGIDFCFLLQINLRYCSQRKVYSADGIMSTQKNDVDSFVRRCISPTMLVKIRGQIASKLVGILTPLWKNHSSPTFVPWIQTSIFEPFAIGTKDENMSLGYQ